jgi:hypothetical protein
MLKTTKLTDQNIAIIYYVKTEGNKSQLTNSVKEDFAPSR